MSLLSREALLRKKELTIKKVDLGELGHVYVKEMNGMEKDCFEQSIVEIKKDGKTNSNLENYRSKLLVCTVCDAKGTLLLKKNDVSLLSKNNGARVLDKMLTEAQSINAISEADKEELVKN